MTERLVRDLVSVFFSAGLRKRRADYFEAVALWPRWQIAAN
jgi:hypothetical protein